MKINSDASLKVAAGTFKRFKGDWIAVHRAAEVRDDGVLVIKSGASKTATNRRRTAAAQAG
jgi:hypothetical protein